MDSSDGLRAAQAKMRAAGEPELAIEAFRDRCRQLVAGAAATIPEDEIEPLSELPALDKMPPSQADAIEALRRTAVVKINGGLGTSMGLSRAKGLLVVKDGLSFLEIAARQVLALRAHHRVRLPLVLMNSAGTREDSLAALAGYAELPADLPPDFLQGLEPKLRVEDLTPVSWPRDPALEWCPAGHGDLFVALHASGMLERMLDGGYEYVFISNTDNLGAVVDPRMLGWMAAEGLDFVSEQCDRTPADRKGGHLARSRATGRLVLRETAQTAPEDRDSMQDIARHRFFNANNIWLRLPALAELVAGGGGVLGLPLIANAKTVDPADASSPAVYQLETAIGSAIGLFERARAVRVGRERFVPVKTTDDLLALRSDCFELTDDARIVVAPARRRPGAPHVELDPEHFKLLDDFEARFADGPPSLLHCERLVVRGDVVFGTDVTIAGTARIENDGPTALRIADGSRIGDE